MSIARGDLARRAALADNLAVPEPWSSNDDPRVFAAIRDLKDRFRQLGITDENGKGRLPDFLLDYEHLPPIKPTTLDRAHTRNSSATRWDQNGNLVEDSSDTLRLQRDPATQEVTGLLYEPLRTQLNSTDPTDPTKWNTKINTTLSSGGSARGLSVVNVVENNDTNNFHTIEEKINTSDGTPVAYDAIVKPDGRTWVSLVQTYSDGGGNSGQAVAFFDIDNVSTGSTSTTNTSIISQTIEDLGGGWVRCKFVVSPNVGFSHNNDRYRLVLAKGDNNRKYDGDGTSGIDFLYYGATESREVTSPILTGNATRGADEVDHRFSFPDKTTGVAFSINQQFGGVPNKGTANVFFGTTSDNRNSLHGVLMEGKTGLLNGTRTDGFQKVSRNSNNDNVNGDAALDETIDRFQVKRQGAFSEQRRAVFTVRQIAIHTRPHTQKQKDTLRDQYLTQP